MISRVKAWLLQHQKRIQWALILLILAGLIIIYFLRNQLIYESEASRYFNKGSYDVAAQKYLLAYDAASDWTGRDRYLYLVAQCYYNSQDWSRAFDFYLRLNKEYPDSYWAALAQPSIERTIHMVDPDSDLVPEQLRARTPLARARADVRASYKRLVVALKENRSGVSVALEQEYQKYCKANEVYRAERAKAYASVAAGNPPDPVEAPPAPVVAPAPVAPSVAPINTTAPH